MSTQAKPLNEILQALLRELPEQDWRVATYLSGTLATPTQLAADLVIPLAATMATLTRLENADIVKHELKPTPYGPVDLYYLRPEVDQTLQLLRDSERLQYSHSRTR